MTDRVVSTIENAQVSLVGGDTLTVTPEGWLNFDGFGGAILPNGNNIEITLDGHVSNLTANGIHLSGNDITVTIGATGLLRAQGHGINVNNLSENLSIVSSGFILSGSSALSMNNDAPSSSITLTATSVIQAGTGIHFQLGDLGGHSISNAGRISTTGDAITLDGSDSVITNSGTIFSQTIGIFSNATTGITTVANTGAIRSIGNDAIQTGAGLVLNNGGLIDSASGDGVQTGAASMTGSTITNSGQIRGYGNTSAALNLGGGADSVVNTGFLQGGPAGSAVLLGDGVDIFNGRFGQQVGAVNGGAGADTLWGGATIDRLEGGTENDQINGGGMGDYIDGGAGYDFARYDFATIGVHARLDNAALNTGEAAGDTMYNFEGLVGSQNGDILVGNNLAIGNQIYGLGGNDTIRGLGGADTLYGNAGADSIFTGDGTDTVWVQAADRIATQLDRVFDFTDGQDHLRFQGISEASATITDSQGGTLISFNVAGGHFLVFLDGITKAASADQIFFV